MKTIEENRVGIGKRIRNRRRELKMTQGELAERLGYSDLSSISKIEQGRADIPQSKLLPFAEALKTSVGYLLEWDKSTLAESVSEKYGSIDFTEAEIRDILDYIELVLKRR